MIDAMTLAESAMLNDTERMRLLAHNLANATSPGFRREVSVLRPLFSQMVDANLRVALPRAVGSVRLDTTHGTMRHTAAALDVAIEGDPFFVLRSDQGEVYTRQGNFQLDEGGRLVSQSGLAVQGEGGDIVLSTVTPRIDREGKVYEGETLVGQLRLVRFDNPAALSSSGNGLFEAPEGLARIVDSPSVRQGFLEASNVIAVREMVRLIETVRHFETSQRLVRGYDNMIGITLSTLGQV
jgi:flagellar basal-body rod protein FlgG